MAVNPLNEGNLRVTDGSPAATGGVVNYNAMTPKLNTANAVIIPLNASGRLPVTPNCGPGCTADTTEVRGVVLGYFTTALAQRVAALETLLAGVSRTTHNGYSTRRFNQVNLWLTNGTNNTYSAKGYGNLVLGYDTNTLSRTRTGSHDIIVGDDHGWTGSAGVVFGSGNRISGSGATVTGGSGNAASGSRASVSGGSETDAIAAVASVSGGAATNTAGGLYSSVSGGFSKAASGEYSSVSGGSAGSAPSQFDWARRRSLPGFVTFVSTRTSGRSASWEPSVRPTSLTCTNSRRWPLTCPFS